VSPSQVVALNSGCTNQTSQFSNGFDRELPWIADSASRRRSVDLSDDIGYSVHDFEDAIVNGYIDVRALSSRVNHADLVDSMVEWIGGEYHTTISSPRSIAWMDSRRGSKRGRGRARKWALSRTSRRH